MSDGGPRDTLIASDATPDAQKRRLPGRVSAWTGDRTLAYAVMLIGVALPTIRMLRWVLGGSLMQYSDYWPMLDSIVEDDGAIRWAGLLEARNGHPVVLPKLLYLANANLFHGSNVALGCFVLTLGLGMVAMVGVLHATRPESDGGAGSASWVATAFAVMAPAGAWSYLKAMSGTAWLLSNLFVLAAMVAQGRRWRGATVAFGLVASISYGTGLLVWPTLLVVCLLRDRKSWRSRWPVWATGTVVLGLYVRWRLANPVKTGSSDLHTFLRQAVTLVLDPVLPNRVIVAAAVAVGAVVLLVACRDRLDAAAPWIALVLFGAGASLMIARTRVVGVQSNSRYWSVSEWIWIGLLGLGVLALRGRPWRLLFPVLLVAVTLVHGDGEITQLENARETQNLVAIVMVMGKAEGNNLGGQFQPFPEVTAEARSLDHYPFDGNFDFGCDLLGESVEVEPQLPDGSSGQVGDRPRPGLLELREFTGWVSVPGGGVECIVVVDAAGTVVGAGTTRPVAGDRVYIRAVAPVDYFLTVAVRTEPDGPLWAVPKES